MINRCKLIEFNIPYKFANDEFTKIIIQLSELFKKLINLEK